VVSLFLSNDTATTETYTLSLHDALPISRPRGLRRRGGGGADDVGLRIRRRRSVPRRDAQQRHHERDRRARGRHRQRLASARGRGDRKSTRLNSSHDQISYAVFCLKKKKK